ncbi:MAG: aspartyl protease family protein, partial [Proteobacteria bacterium]|nr:aspartyl protease family protein [Pseudomonadota bacterium]
MKARWRSAAWLLLAVPSVPSGAAPVTIPFTLRNGMPFFEVKANGRTVPILFDLGDFSTLRLDRSVLEQIGAERTGAGGKIIQAQGGPVESPEYRLQSVELGPVRFGPVTASMDAHDPSYQPDQVGQAGFLGTGLLKA